MFGRLSRVLPVIAALCLLVGAVFVMRAGAVAPANEHFQRTWARTDQPVASGQASRTWMWGPEAFTAELQEPYVESPSGQRKVQYFDKARMEITNPNGDSGSIWYVTNGLLVVELITGRMQTGDASFSQRVPATVNVAGDADDPSGPTYSTFGAFLDAEPVAVGTTLTSRISRSGQVTADPALVGQGMTVALIDDVTNHAIATPFWQFMNSTGTVWSGDAYVTAPLFENAYFATGRPITEAYWANVKVGGNYQDVLMQCFERRCLTYNPANALAWQVEAGNVGAHYHTWRYQQPVEPTATSDVPASATPTEVTVPSATATEPEEPASEYAFAFDFGSTVESTRRVRPEGFAVDPYGYITIADGIRGRIATYSSDGEFRYSAGTPGTGDGQIYYATDVAIDKDGYHYVADYRNNRISKFQGSTFIATFGTSGSGAGQLNEPACVTVHADVVYVCDRNNRRVSRFSTAGTYIDSFGSQVEGPYQFSYLTSVAVDQAGNVYVADSGLGAVKVFSPTLQYQQILELPADQPPLLFPSDVAIGPDGIIWLIDRPSDLTRITRFDADGDYLDTWGTTATIPGLMDRGWVIAVDAIGNVYVGGEQYIYDPSLSGYSPHPRTSKISPDRVIEWTIADDNRGRFDMPFDIAVTTDDRLLVSDGTDSISRIDIWQPDGNPAVLDGFRFGMSPPSMTADLPAGIATGPDGSVYVTDTANNIVSQFDENWVLVRTWDAADSLLGPLQQPRGIATDAAGNVYVVEIGNDRIRKFTADGTVLGSWGSSGAGPGQFETPMDIAVAGERVYVTDWDLHRVVVFDLDGTYITDWGEFGDGPGQFFAPRGVAVDTGGYVYVVDSENSRVQKFTPEGDWIVTFGGSSSGPLNRPQGIAVTSEGTVYVVDTSNDRVVAYEPQD